MEGTLNQLPTVLYVIDTLATGGAEKSLLEITARLTKFRPVICTVFTKNADLKKEFLKLGIPLIELGVNSKLWWLEGSHKLKKVILQVQPDIIHATLFKAEIITRLAANKYIPNIGSFVNDSYGKERYRSVGLIMFFKLKVIQCIDALTAKRVDHFVSITHSIRSTNMKALSVPPSRITVIYRGRDIQKLLSINTSAVRQIRQQYGPVPIFLTVARLLKRKGYTESIKAFSKILKKYPTALYLIAGEGHDRKYFETLIANLNLKQNIFLLGNRKDVPELLAASDYFIFPSHYEGQGGALVEAMLLSKPIVASKIPVIEEQVQHNESARLFQVRNAEAMYEEMMWMINHPHEAKILGEEARKNAFVNFSIDIIIDKHEQMYLALIEKKKRENQ